MTSRRIRASSVALAAFAVLHLNPATLLACAVCFGDPDSPMTKGAVAGIVVLGGFISSVLLGIVSVIAFWMFRCRRLSQSAILHPADEP